MKMWLIVFLVILLVIFAPNLIWLNWSTLFIRNQSSKSIDNITLEICSQTVHVTAKPESSSLHFLPECGDTTLIVRANNEIICQSYVQGDMFDVEVDTGTKNCNATLPIFSSLFLFKLFK
jgi:hypothetical protein